MLGPLLVAGVCHTDIHTRHGYSDMGGGKRLNMGDRGAARLRLSDEGF